MKRPNQEWTIRPNGSLRIQSTNPEPSLTQQSFKDECDINKIMEKYHKTREITHLNLRKGVYADLSNVTDYMSALDTVAKATSAFDSLPSKLRTRFENDPSQLLAFVNNPTNYDEAVSLGLVQKPIPQSTSPSQPTQPPQNPINTQTPHPQPIPNT